MKSLCFFPIQQWPCHNNIATDGGLNLFDDCAAECVGRKVYLFFLYTPGTIADSQTERAPTKINKNGAVAKVRI